MNWIDEFVSLMSGHTITFEQIDRAHLLKNTYLPEKFYKFRAVSSYALDNFRTDTVWLCSTDKYNDPYECATNMNYEVLSRENAIRNTDGIINEKIRALLSEEEVTQILNHDNPIKSMAYVLLGKDKNIAPEKHDAIVAAFFGAAKKIHSDMMASFTNFAQKGTKVCSFSSRFDSSLMWGHYAASHTGFCLEYDFTALATDDIRRRIMYPVVYSTELFDATKYILQSMSGGSFNNLFGVMAATRKASDWSYEQEWRFVLPMGESFADMNYSMPTPSSLFIGARTLAKDEAELMSIAASKGIHVYKMRLSTSEFNMTPELIYCPIPRKPNKT